MPRCFWCPEDPLYAAYHDQEWGVPLRDAHGLFELLLLEGFQAGLSWITVLRKREHYRKVMFGFDVQRLATMSDPEIEALLQDPGIIRNRLKIKAAVQNSQVFQEIQKEFGSFDAYIWSFTDGKTIDEPFTMRTTSPLSDAVSKDLKKRGMTFVGSTIIYSYLQAMGVINGHAEDCWCKKGETL